MEIINPQGKKTIILEKNQIETIKIKDIDSGSRNYELDIILSGENAQCYIFGKIETTKQDRKYWQIRQIFKGKNQKGQIELNGAAENQSFLKLNGTAILEKNSIQADAKVQEKMILFEDATGSVIPNLTVNTNNVKKAIHSASIAPFSTEKILYLLSRGLSI